MYSLIRPESVVLDYAALTGGRPHYIYPQHQLADTLPARAAKSGSAIPSGRYGSIPAALCWRSTDQTVTSRGSPARPRPGVKGLPARVGRP